MQSSILHVVSVYLLTVTGIYPYAINQTGHRCVEQHLNGNIEIKCSQIPEHNQLKSISSMITHQTIICSKTTKRLQLTDNQTVGLPKLVFFHMENCPTENLPKQFFRNLLKLQAVSLDNLPISMLQEDVFDNSSNLIELTLSRMYNLTSIHPRFLGHQDLLSTLSLVESSIDPVQLRHVLLSIYITLQHLYWRKNMHKLSLSTDYFRNFRFESLILEYDGIDNVDFLAHVTTGTLSLRGNPIGRFEPVLMKASPTLLDELITLDLSETSIAQLIPDFQTKIIFPKLSELILSDNIIDQISPRLQFMFPALNILDLRHNRLVVLPNLDYMLRLRQGKILLDGNQFHCNCKMKWVTDFNDKQIKNLQCQIVDGNGTVAKQIPFMDNEIRMNMVCTAPNLYLRIKNSSHLNYSTLEINTDRIKIYDIELHSEQSIDWKCVAEGDPTPSLSILNKQNETLWSESPQNYQYAKVETNYSTISYTDFNVTQNHAEYACKAINLAGISELRFKISKVTPKPQIKHLRMHNLTSIQPRFLEHQDQLSTKNTLTPQLKHLQAENFGLTHQPNFILIIYVIFLLFC